MCIGSVVVVVYTARSGGRAVVRSERRDAGRRALIVVIQVLRDIWR